MIHIPTAPWAHLVFDIIAWAAGIGMGLSLYRWRLRATTLQIASKVGGPGAIGSVAAVVPAAAGGAQAKAIPKLHICGYIHQQQ